MDVLRLRVPLWQRAAYYATDGLADLALWLSILGAWPLHRNPWGMAIIAWRWGIDDRLVPGVDRRLRRELLAAGWTREEM